MPRFVIENSSSRSDSNAPGTSPGLSRGAVIAVVGAKGGCGATTLAMHMAAARARSGRAALLDFDFHRGGVAGALDLWVERSAHHVVELGPKLDPSGLEENMIEHRSGMFVLAQPFDLNNLVEPKAAEVVHILNVAAQSFDRVFVDGGSRIDEALLGLVLRADLIVLVCDPHVGSLRDTLRLVRLFRSLDIPEGRIRMVLNRLDEDLAFSLPETAQSHLKIPFVATVARDDASFRQADFSGKLVWDVNRRSPTSKGLEKLWDIIGGDGEEILHRYRRNS